MATAVLRTARKSVGPGVKWYRGHEIPNFAVTVKYITYYEVLIIAVEFVTLAIYKHRYKISFGMFK